MVPISFLPTSTHQVFQLSQNDSLTTISGTIFPKIVFESDLHRDLRESLSDISWADHIWKCYRDLLLPTLSKQQAAQNVVEKFLRMNCFNLGCANLSAMSSFRASLPLSLHSSWDTFIHAISCKEHNHETTSKISNIVILTPMSFSKLL